MMSDTQKRLRRWFQRHRWHTGNTPTGIGAYLETPIQHGITYISGYPADGNQYRHHTEYIAQMEIDRFKPDTLCIGVLKRTRYTSGPDFEKKTKPWPNHPETCIRLTYAELKHVVKLMEVCMVDSASADLEREVKRHAGQ